VRVKKSVAGVAVAMALTFGIVWGGAALSGWVRVSVQESAAYRHSVILTSVFSGEDDVGLGAILTDARARGLFFKFARTLTNAYVSFELIPYGQLETFSVVYAALGPHVEIDDFIYRGHDLIITGSVLSEASYHEFLASLSGSGYFLDVRGRFDISGDGGVRFEIECLAAQRHGLQVLATNFTSFN